MAPRLFKKALGIVSETIRIVRQTHISAPPDQDSRGLILTGKKA